MRVESGGLEVKGYTVTSRSPRPPESGGYVTKCVPQKAKMSESGRDYFSHEGLAVHRVVGLTLLRVLV